MPNQNPCSLPSSPLASRRRLSSGVLPDQHQSCHSRITVPAPDQHQSITVSAPDQHQSCHSEITVSAPDPNNNNDDNNNDLPDTHSSSSPCLVSYSPSLLPSPCQSPSRFSPRRRSPRLRVLTVPVSSPPPNRYRLGSGGAGESSFLLYNNSETAHFSSSGFPSFCPFVNVDPSYNNNFGINPLFGQYHHYDEALQFVANSIPSREEKKEICAAFVKEHFTCPICLDVVIDSTVISCGHIFCRLCLQTWLQIKPNNCPVCSNEVSIQLPQHDVDNAVETVANYFSPEWQTRRQSSLASRHTFTTTPNDPYPSIYLNALMWIPMKVGELFRVGSLYWSNNGPMLMQSTREYLVWSYENITVPDIVRGVLIVSLLLILFFTSDNIADFAQYTYYMMRNYDKRLPIMKQLEQLVNPVVTSQKYKDFTSYPDTIFAKFIKSFYA